MHVYLSNSILGTFVDYNLDYCSVCHASYDTRQAAQDHLAQTNKGVMVALDRSPGILNN